MAHNGTAPLRATSVDMEIPVKWSDQPPEHMVANKENGVNKSHGVLDVALRVVLSMSALAAVIVMVTSKQSKLIHFSPTLALPLDANWTQVPSYIYFVVALLVACVYSIVTGLQSLSALKLTGGRSTKKQFHVAIVDSLLFGIVSSAMGATMGVAYIGLRGNKYSYWKEICNAYGSFCHHLAASITMHSSFQPMRSDLGVELEFKDKEIMIRIPD
ncbi:CASP-like protein 1 [Rutidosis leptorrhynchoides]|uniref:CASP-like protein 1 n=1 Tax=Rutidosis leptorrhynchoides TaxID=125765 RepID=UPI003A991BA8